MILRRSLTLLGGAACAAALLGAPSAVSAAPANASSPTGTVKQIGPGLSSCPKGYFCAWTNVSYTGTGVAWSGTANWWRDPGSLSFIDDNASSLYNNGYATNPSAVRTYNDFDFKGTTGCMSVGSKNPNLQTAYNDKISSHKWVSGC
jgi:hypothetical protein